MGVELAKRPNEKSLRSIEDIIESEAVRRARQSGGVEERVGGLDEEKLLLPLTSLFI